MEHQEIARFTVQISSVKDATWQGSVTTEDASFHFQSELQLLKWLFEKYPRLLPDVKQHDVTQPGPICRFLFGTSADSGASFPCLSFSFPKDQRNSESGPPAGFGVPFIRAYPRPSPFMNRAPKNSRHAYFGPRPMICGKFYQKGIAFLWKNM